ncbi:hypothetical protein OIO90_003643 [Microbotryomycetes sp. JL221]|nr:hypothetical protein OIO90_003643 [Microbotryomycetes sp. JL221]
MTSPRDIKFHGRLPGDAIESIQLDQDTATAPPVASTSSSTAPRDLTSPARTVTLTSTSSDGTQSKEFKAKYFRPVSNPFNTQHVVLPDSYFQPTSTELQQAFASQVERTRQLTDGPLLTSKLRQQQHELKTKQNATKWPHTRIRIKFSDQSQLEGMFASTDKLVHIYEFVRLAIHEQHRHKPFLLYQTPPRKEFKKGDVQFRGKTLMDLQLTPSSVFYIKFVDDEQLNASGTRPPLITQLIESISDFPLPTIENQDSTHSVSNKSIESNKKLPFGGSAGKVTPNWLKIGKSK